MITVQSDHLKAVVTEDLDGPVITYWRALRRGGETRWVFDHEARPAVPFHAARDLAHAMVHAA